MTLGAVGNNLSIYADSLHQQDKPNQSAASKYSPDSPNPAMSATPMSLSTNMARKGASRFSDYINQITSTAASFVSSIAANVRSAHTPHLNVGADIADYNPLNPGEVASTSFALQAAEQLIDKDGHLDKSRIPLMIQNLRKDSPISEHHRDNAINTLQAMLDEPALGKIIDGTCEDKPLSGDAIVIVCDTLGLPWESQPTKVEARKALVASL